MAEVSAPSSNKPADHPGDCYCQLCVPIHRQDQTRNQKLVSFRSDMELAHYRTRLYINLSTVSARLFEVYEELNDIQLELSDVQSEEIVRQYNRRLFVSTVPVTVAAVTRDEQKKT